MSVVEILFHEITEADIRKINAVSNDTRSGGGARDLRFSIDFEPCLNRLFPEDVVLEGKTPYRIGSFIHSDQAKNKTVVHGVRYAFRPTNSRPNEIRIAQINNISFFQDIPDISEEDGILFMAFIRHSTGLPQAQYLTEKQIVAPGSNVTIASAMREAIRTRRRGCAVVFSVELN